MFGKSFQPGETFSVSESVSGSQEIFFHLEPCYSAGRKTFLGYEKCLDSENMYKGENFLRLEGYDF